MLRQESRRAPSTTSRSAWALALSALRHMSPRLLDYLKPNFHPDDHDNYELARAYLAEIGRLDA